jgi:hypothetical protein
LGLFPAFTSVITLAEYNADNVAKGSGTATETDVVEKTSEINISALETDTTASGGVLKTGTGGVAKTTGKSPTTSHTSNPTAAGHSASPSKGAIKNAAGKVHITAVGILAPAGTLLALFWL